MHTILLPEDEQEARAAMNGAHYLSALIEIKNLLRSYQKHSVFGVEELNKLRRSISDEVNDALSGEAI